MAKKKGKPFLQPLPKHYSGPLSEEFWKRVNHLKDPVNLFTCSALGCALQDLESRTIYMLTNSELEEGIIIPQISLTIPPKKK